MLVAYKLSKLASENWSTEAIQKKIFVEGAAKKLRIILSSVAWDMKIAQWLHLTLIENANHDFLSAYIGILQVLRSKVPTLVDRMLNIPLAHSKLGSLNAKIVNFVNEKPWEPAIVHAASSCKLPVKPFVIMVPSGSINFNTSSK